MNRWHRSLRVAVVAVVAMLASGCGADSPRDLRADEPDGELVEQGERAILENGCGSCHVIPGITGADGETGPPLVDVSKQVYIAGVLANTPENMELWLLDPQAVDPRTAMPDVGLQERDAEAITAYLRARTGTG